MDRELSSPSSGIINSHPCLGFMAGGVYNFILLKFRLASVAKGMLVALSKAGI